MQIYLISKPEKLTVIAHLVYRILCELDICDNSYTGESEFF